MRCCSVFRTAQCLSEMLTMYSWRVMWGMFCLDLYIYSYTSTDKKTHPTVSWFCQKTVLANLTANCPRQDTELGDRRSPIPYMCRLLNSDGSFATESVLRNCSLTRTDRPTFQFSGSFSQTRLLLADSLFTVKLAERWRGTSRGNHILNTPQLKGT